MEGLLSKSTKWLLKIHIWLFFGVIGYLLFVKVLKNHFYPFDERMPWQETVLNLPLKFMLSIQLIFFWSKLFVIFFFIVLLKGKFNVLRGVSVRFFIVLIIYILIKSGILHEFLACVVKGYDFQAPSMNPNHYMFF